MKFGLEKEFFLFKNDPRHETIQDPLIVPTNVFPFDESGILVEARGKPSSSILEAVFLLKAECFRIERLVRSKGLYISDMPNCIVSKQTKMKLRRDFDKQRISYQNIYGYEKHKNKSCQQTAGVHISFTDEQLITWKDNQTSVYNSIFDFLTLFKYLDEKFLKEIENARRRPGFYELKPDGRIEYRSLPSNVDLDKVIDVLTEYRFK
jgi:hypothetical protein